VMRLLAGLCRDSAKAIVLVGHDLNLAHQVASHALLLMGDGQWQAGPVAEVMQAPLLSRCLGHPIETVRHGARTIYIPAEETRDD
jgi:iron complex transport system ATP-binding protein